MFLLKYDDFLAYDKQSERYVLPEEQRVRDETERTSFKTAAQTLIKDWRLYLMLLPMLLTYFLWRYLPMTELLAAFKEPTNQAISVAQQNWFGLTTFRELFFGSLAPQFWGAFRNTFIIAFYGLLFGFPVPIVLALFFNEVKSNVARSVLQVCVYLPKFMSTVVITSLAIALFQGSASGSGQGVVTRLLLSLSNSPALQAAANGQGLVFTTRYFRAIYQITGIWEHAGYDSIVFFAAVIAVSPTSYEAAQMDGAGKLAQMRYVVLPGILSTIVIMLILKIGTLLSVGFEKVYLMSNGANYAAAEIVATLSNKWLTSGANPAYGIAAEMVNNLIGMLLVIGANTVARKATDVSLY